MPGLAMQNIINMEVDVDQLKDNLPLLTVYGASVFLDEMIPEVKWLIQDLIPLGVPTVFASKGGLGKSWLALQKCIALACGKAFLTFEAQPPMGAIYFGLEDSKEAFHRRLRSIVGHYKACDDWSEENNQNLRKNLAVPFVNWHAKNATSYLPDLIPNIEMILDINKSNGVRPGVMVIDTLARVSEGDENTVQALRPVLNACHAISGYGYTPLVLHHVSKGQDGSRQPGKGPTITERMSTEWVRGSSAIVDNFRCILQFAAISEDEAAGAGLDEEKARRKGYLIYGATKLNDGGQMSDWLFLEQDDYGRWFVPHDGIETLAKIRGAKAVAALSKQMALLVDIYEMTRHGLDPDIDRLIEKHSNGSKNPQSWWRQNISRLRKSGYIQQKTFALTIEGLKAMSHVTK